MSRLQDFASKLLGKHLFGVVAAWLPPYTRASSLVSPTWTSGEGAGGVGEAEPPGSMRSRIDGDASNTLELRIPGSPATWKKVRAEGASVGSGATGVTNEVTVAARLFFFEDPAAADTDGIHAAFGGDTDHTKGELDLGTLAEGNLDTVIEAVDHGVGFTAACVGDSAAEAGVTIDEDDGVIVIHFEDGVSTVADVETALGLASTVAVKTGGTGATVLSAATDEFEAEALTGGVDGNEFPGAFSDPDIPRNVTVTFGAGWDGGDVTVRGTDPAGDDIEETIADADGTTVAGEKVFATVTGASKEAIGSDPATASIGFGDALGIVDEDGEPHVIVAGFSLLHAGGVVEAATLDEVNGSFTPTTPPDASTDYHLLVNVEHTHVVTDAGHTHTI